MANSASAALAEFKSQRLGSLLGGGGSTIDPGPIGNGMDSAAQRLDRTQPSATSTSFLDSIRSSGKRTNDLLMQNIRNKQQATIPTANTGYNVSGGGGGGNSGAGGPRGQYGLTVPAANSFNQLSSAFSKQFGHGISVNDGGRTYAQQQILYNQYLNGTGNLAAKPGTSVHESGLAMDWGGIGGVGSATHNWLRQNAANFGWYWTGGSFSQIESWHWEFHPEWAGR